MKTYKYHKKSEHGQILILLTAGLAVLLGFTALAIDGGMFFADRRASQNAADAAALAGANAAAIALDNAGIYFINFTCSATAVQNTINTAKTTAVQSAATNGFTIPTTITNNNGVAVDCGIRDTGGIFEKYLDIRVQVAHTTRTSFAQLFYSGPLRNQVEAVVRIRPRVNPTMGHTIASLSANCSNNVGGMVFAGGVDVNVSGGGIFSTSCMEIGGRVTVSSEPLGIYYSSGAAPVVTSGQVSPPPLLATAQMPPVNIPPPNCSGLPLRGDYAGSGTINPGRWGNIRTTATGHNLILNPGLYCISNGFSGTGGTITGNGVTLYLTGGGFTVGGNVTVRLSAPTTNSPPAIKGILIYMAPTNTSAVSLAGSSASSYIGTIYAPNSSVEVSGNSGMEPTYRTQLIGGFVKFSGNTTINITSSPEDTYQETSYLDLYK
ncbi:MAG: pilus assembly protein TadG-related protein [Anaerolineaceae bacterium]|nr:pilus assembly protein TadG-related protein [Anaerolineaceae bacterium]